MNESKSKVGRMKNLHVEFEELTRGNQMAGEDMAGKHSVDFPPYSHLHVAILPTSWLTHHGQTSQDEVGGKNLVLANPKKKWNT